MEMLKSKLNKINLILMIGLISIVLYEGYVSKMFNKIMKSQNQSYLSNREYNKQLELYKAYSKRGDIVMLGNSITYNVDWNELLNRKDIINRGIGNDITEGFLNRLEYVYNVKPKICFIMGGINDIMRGIKPEYIINNLDQISKQLIENDIKPIIISVLYVTDKHPKFEVINKKVSLLNIKLKKICATANIEFIDLNNVLSTDEKLLKPYSIDGLHLTSLGYKKWGNAILPVIQRELGD